MTDITTAQVRRAVAGSAWLDVGVAGFDAWLAARDIEKTRSTLDDVVDAASIIIGNGDTAEIAAMPPGTVGVQSAVAARDKLLADPLEWLREYAAAQPTVNASAQAAQWAAACEAADAATPAERLEALYAAVEDTVKLLERAHLLPSDHHYVQDTRWEQTRVYVGDLRFIAEMTGSRDTPAAHYMVTSSSDVADVHGSERTTRDLNEVRAWLLFWAVQASQAAAGAA